MSGRTLRTSADTRTTVDRIVLFIWHTLRRPCFHRTVDVHEYRHACNDYVTRLLPVATLALLSTGFCSLLNVLSDTQVEAVALSAI